MENTYYFLSTLITILTCKRHSKKLNRHTFEFTDTIEDLIN